MLSESSLQKKRQFALERAERLKDPRMRAMGIDKAALDEQVKEKEAMKKLEKERDNFYDTQALMMDKHAQVLQREVDEIRLQREREVLNYRETFQKKQCGREWDLNDPKRVRNTLPPRVCDDDPRCGTASMQKFEGEDLDAANRRKAQAQQQREWAEQQMDEKLMKKWNEKEANRQYEDRSEETAFRTYQIEQTISQQRQQIAVTTSEFNKALAEQKRKERLQEKMSQTKKNMEEIENMLNDDMLNEKESVSTLNSRQRPDNFKGLTPEQLEQIHKIQDAQREQLREKRLKEAEEERQWAQQESMENRMATALDRQRDRERREAARRLGQEREQQATDAKQRKKDLDEVYRNAIGEEYFKFGKCLD